jgi:pre-mRNA-processing factor SLU7
MVRSGIHVQHGKELTHTPEYIPNFIANKPFYVPDTDDSGKDYLEHQRLQKVQDDTLANSQWYDRGKKKGPAATKFRKGACENCGAMTHKTKDCLQRKRKIGAKYNGRDIQADEVVEDVRLGFDAKRDRWNGIDASEAYQQVVEQHEELEKLKRAAQGEDETADGDRYEEETDMGRQQSTATRQLRLREDTAKYLLNLDMDSAKYDPKTRTMVDSGATTGDRAALLVAEENFVRKSGDAAEFEKATRYAWEKQERGDMTKMHLQANPTEGAFLRKKELEEAKAKAEAKRKALLDKYGTQPDNSALKEVAVVASERYVEYDESGQIKGTQKKGTKSKFAEDVFINNHTSVWGSWWSDFKWGYACCHQMIKNSYCTGEQGKIAFDEAARLRIAADLGADLGDSEEIPKQVAWKDEEANEQHVSNAVEDVRKVTLNNKADADKRKRRLDEMRAGVTEDDMEEYKRTRVQGNDPMAKMLGKDELLS